MVKKMTKNEILNEIGNFLPMYLKSGQVKIDSYIRKANKDIADFDTILKIHFLLKEDVIEFVEKLPALLQQIKSTSKGKEKVVIGEIKGKINWEKTFNHRNKSRNNELYSIRERKKAFENVENVILKTIIDVLYDLLVKQNLISSLEYSWSLKWNALKLNLVIAKKNVYLNQLKSAEILDNRALLKVMLNRNKVYSESARLLLYYNKINSSTLNNQEIVSLLNETFIEPEQIDVLFELYWSINILMKFTDEYKLLPLSKGDNKVAIWEKDEKTFTMYHNSNGSSRVSFGLSLDDLEPSDNEFLIQKKNSLLTLKEASNQMFGTKSTPIFLNGRPDILIEVRNNKNEIIKLLVGEVKHTVNVEYALKGLEELIDYMSFSKVDGIFVANTPIIVEGVLCLDKVPLNSCHFDNIKILTTQPRDM